MNVYVYFPCSYPHPNMHFTHVIPQRLKEAAKINLSLSALGNVISSLVNSKIKHVPYRDRCVCVCVCLVMRSSWYIA
jgi:hypothetical protein